jgi:hypothetical protein
MGATNQYDTWAGLYFALLLDPYTVAKLQLLSGIPTFGKLEEYYCPAPYKSLHFTFSFELTSLIVAKFLFCL